MASWTTWLLDGEIVCQSGSRRDCTLGDGRRSVHITGTILKEAVEMQRGRFVAELVEHVHYDSITDIRRDRRDWPLVVDANGWSLEGTVGVARCPSDIEVIGHCRRLRKRQ